ncbi:MAG: hypothetical protein QOK20_625 [Acidimicrobiaceae bacterium]|jgi:hypothetical protein|nr:hypothetical protein [Acidimicrobiaceae bacterium]
MARHVSYPVWSNLKTLRGGAVTLGRLPCFQAGEQIEQASGRLDVQLGA